VCIAADAPEKVVTENFVAVKLPNIGPQSIDNNFIYGLIFIYGLWAVVGFYGVVVRLFPFISIYLVYYYLISLFVHGLIRKNIIGVETVVNIRLTAQAEDVIAIVWV